MIRYITLAATIALTLAACGAPYTEKSKLLSEGTSRSGVFKVDYARLYECYLERGANVGAKFVIYRQRGMARVFLSQPTVFGHTEWYYNIEFKRIATGTRVEIRSAHPNDAHLLWGRVERCAKE